MDITAPQLKDEEQEDNDDQIQATLMLQAEKDQANEEATAKAERLAHRRAQQHAQEQANKQAKIAAAHAAATKANDKNKKKPINIAIALRGIFEVY
ncbi:hypothetical protein LX36DRAFT_717204 [Colletotrichum falcatum]|nr:hypothetical protein LX36DRAFT_717204 [Colletotrichum falcatum]